MLPFFKALHLITFSTEAPQATLTTLNSICGLALKDLLYILIASQT